MLLLFEAMSGLKVNVYNSPIFARIIFNCFNMCFMCLCVIIYCWVHFNGFSCQKGNLVILDSGVF